MKKLMLALIILASLIPGILAVAQYLENQQKEKESRKNEKLLNSKIDTLKLDNSDLQKELQNLAKDNAKLSHQLSETALKLNQNVIGTGDLDIEVNTSKKTEFSFRLVNNSDLSVNNANILISDYSAIMKCPIAKESAETITIKKDCYKGHFIKYTGVNINPHGAILDENKVYQFTADYMNYGIQVATRKKTIIYHLVYKIIKGNIQRSCRVYNLINNKKIFVSEENDLELNSKYWNENFYEKVLYTED